MASSSSLSGSSVDPTWTAKEIEDLKQLCIFAESDEFDFDDNEFNEVEVEPNSNCKAKVDALAQKFGVKLTEKGDVLKPGTRYIPRYIKFATNPRYMPAGTRHIKSTKTRHVSGTCRHVPRHMPGAGN